jgi:hypothetical protein
MNTRLCKASGTCPQVLTELTWIGHTYYRLTLSQLRITLFQLPAPTPCIYNLISFIDQSTHEQCVQESASLPASLPRG